MKLLLRLLIPAIILIAVLVAVFDKTPESIPEVSTESLPTVGSAAKLRELLAAMPSGMYSLGVRAEMAVGSADSAVKSVVQDQAYGGAATSGSDFSRTNVQVDGVDEADVVKTDGKYIYYVNKTWVGIALAAPASEMKVVANLNFSGQDFLPQELYVDETHLVVIGAGNRPGSMPGPTGDSVMPKPGAELAPQIYPNPGLPTTRAIVYDIRDKANPKQVRQVELEGSYISSRMIGANLYLTSRKYIDTYRIMNEDPEVPAYRDTAGTGDYNKITYQNIRYFPGFSEPSYLMVGAVNLENGEPLQAAAYLGAGQNVYSSSTHLYVAVTQYQQPAPQAAGSTEKQTMDLAPLKADTSLYKFALAPGKTIYQANGTVPGTILNQFSMDEHKGFFRIATTTGQIWRSDENTSKNNVYILDESLKLTGKLEGIAPGEKIYSTRFMGDRAYMVTFKTVDPLFVLDLKEPAAPKIAGALKIPGYSDYIQPYDENHIIGFGKDTVESAYPGQANNMAYYLGMKIALFDVSDLEHPVEKFKEIIGDRGTDSELLHNHKALLFDKAKNLLAFPVTLMQVKKQQPGTGKVPPYGEFSFQGALIYRIDLQQGFTLRGRITHLSQDDYLQSGRGWYQEDKNVERILYIGDTLYTLSKKTIKANDLAGLQEINSLTLSP